MPPLYALTPRSAGRLRQLFADGGKRPAADVNARAGARGLTWVKVTSGTADGDGWYPGVVSLDTAGTFADLTRAVLVRGAAGEDLEAGQRYACSRTGDDAATGKARFRVLASTAAAEQDCGAFAGLSADLCLVATLTAAGPCGRMDAGALTLRNIDAGNAVWQSDPFDVELPAGNGTAAVNFTPGNATTRGQPLAWIPSFDLDDCAGSEDPGNCTNTTVPIQYLTLADCGAGTLTFKGGSAPLCDALTTCPPGRYTVRIACGDCAAPVTYTCSSYDDENPDEEARVVRPLDCYSSTATAADAGNWTVGNVAYSTLGRCVAANCTGPATVGNFTIGCGNANVGTASYAVPKRLFLTLSDLTLTSGGPLCLQSVTLPLDAHSGVSTDSSGTGETWQLSEFVHPGLGGLSTAPASYFPTCDTMPTGSAFGTDAQVHLVCLYADPPGTVDDVPPYIAASMDVTFADGGAFGFNGAAGLTVVSMDPFLATGTVAIGALFSGGPSWTATAAVTVSEVPP